MKAICRRCDPDTTYSIPDFTEGEKSELLALKRKSGILAVKRLMQSYALSYRVAKFIVSHVNVTFGQCNCCAFDDLQEEYMICPKCKALNLSWKL